MRRLIERTAGLVLAACILAAVPASAQEPASPAPSPAPSEADAVSLIALMPEDVAGIPLSGAEFTAMEILAGLDDDPLAIQLASLAGAHGTNLQQFAIVSRGGVDGESVVTILAGAIPDVPAAELQPLLVEVLVGPTDPELTSDASISERDVTVIQARPDAGPEDTIYVVSGGEVVWILIGDDVTVAEAIAQLPADA